MKMNLKGRIASTLAAGAMAAGFAFAAPVAANATGNPSHLDQGDLSLACQLQYGGGWTAHLYGSTAYSWKCTTAIGFTQKSVDVNNYCMTIWGVWAIATDASDPYSWKCQGY